MTPPLRTTEPASPYTNPAAKRQGRRISPVVADGVFRALRAGVRQREIARAYGISDSAVFRLKMKLQAEPSIEGYVAVLAELADAEHELRESGQDPQAVEDLIQLVRAGHLARRLKERSS